MYLEDGLPELSQSMAPKGQISMWDETAWVSAPCLLCPRLFSFLSVLFSQTALDRFSPVMRSANSLLSFFLLLPNLQGKTCGSYPASGSSWFLSTAFPGLYFSWFLGSLRCSWITALEHSESKVFLHLFLSSPLHLCSCLLGFLSSLFLAPSEERCSGFHPWDFPLLHCPCVISSLLQTVTNTR